MGLQRHEVAGCCLRGDERRIGGEVKSWGGWQGWVGILRGMMWWWVGEKQQPARGGLLKKIWNLATRPLLILQLDKLGFGSVILSLELCVPTCRACHIFRR